MYFQAASAPHTVARQVQMVSANRSRLCGRLRDDERRDFQSLSHVVADLLAKREVPESAKATFLTKATDYLHRYADATIRP